MFAGTGAGTGGGRGSRIYITLNLILDSGMQIYRWIGYMGTVDKWLMIDIGTIRDIRELRFQVGQGNS